MQTPIGREGGTSAMDTRGAIARPILAEQLKEYQARSKHDLASLPFFSAPLPSPASGISSKADDILYVIWELFIFAFLVFSAVSLYFRYMRVALILICITTFLLVGMKIAKEIRKNRKSKRRMLLPLSM